MPLQHALQGPLHQPGEHILFVRHRFLQPARLRRCTKNWIREPGTAFGSTRAQHTCAAAAQKNMYVTHERIWIL